ncbi:hypothetical protein HDK77DRAFT_147576 [Phyllosticta capitalensis]
MLRNEKSRRRRLWGCWLSAIHMQRAAMQCDASGALSISPMSTGLVAGVDLVPLFSRASSPAPSAEERRSGWIGWRERWPPVAGGVYRMEMAPLWCGAVGQIRLTAGGVLSSKIQMVQPHMYLSPLFRLPRSLARLPWAEIEFAATVVRPCSTACLAQSCPSWPLVETSSRVAAARHVGNPSVCIAMGPPRPTECAPANFLCQPSDHGPSACALRVSIGVRMQTPMWRRETT